MLWVRLDEKPTGRMRPDKRKAPARPWFIGSRKRYHCEHMRGPRGRRFAHVVERAAAYRKRAAGHSFGNLHKKFSLLYPQHDEWYVIAKDGAA